jgi:hypothetical protein
MLNSAQSEIFLSLRLALVRCYERPTESLASECRRPSSDCSKQRTDSCLARCCLFPRDEHAASMQTKQLINAGDADGASLADSVHLPDVIVRTLSEVLLHLYLTTSTF